MVYLQSYVFIHHLSSCPSPPRLRGSSGARQGRVLFLHVHDSAPVHPSSCPSLVTSPTNGTLSPLLLMEPWMCVFFFFFVYLQAGRQSTKKRSVRWLGSSFFLPTHMFFLLYGCIFGLLLPCQHMLCIRLYVLQFTGLYFVQLSGLLITSILSLKCNYVHHVMFLVERHGRLGASPRLWQSFHQWKTKTRSEDGWQRLVVFLITTGGEKNLILTSALSRNLHIKGKCEQHCEHLGSSDNLCMTQHYLKPRI